MGDLIVLAVLITIVGVVSIEFGRTRKDFVRAVYAASFITMVGVDWLPYWYGQITLTLGIVCFGWAAFVYQRPDEHDDLRRGLQTKALTLTQVFYVRLKALFAAGWSSFRSAFEGYRERSKTIEPVRPVNRFSVWLRTLLLIAVSPVLAIPATLLMVVIMWSAGVVVADSSISDELASGLPKFLLGTTVLYWIATLDLMHKHLLICMSLLVATGYLASLLAIRRQQPWRYYSLAGIVLATIYPLTFVLASLAGELNEPLLN
jgi:hypothetical protein